MKDPRFTAEPYDDGDPFLFDTQADFFVQSEENFIRHGTKPAPTAYQFFDDKKNEYIPFEQIPKE